MSSTKKITVAIVDDDTSLCHAMDRLLRAAGFQAVTYLSGEAFLEDPEHGRADCILLDIQLGGMSGFELQNLLTAPDRPLPSFSSPPTTTLKQASRRGKPSAWPTCAKPTQAMRCLKPFAAPSTWTWLRKVSSSQSAVIGEAVERWVTGMGMSGEEGFRVSDFELRILDFISHSAKSVFGTMKLNQ